MEKCPHCGRKAKEALSSSWFPVYTCRKCGKKYCSEDGPPCPKCGAKEYGQYDKVNA
jgi:hypothetical protein